MKLNERLASLEATVRHGFETGERDRLEVKRALENTTSKMDQTIGSISLRLDMHEEWINKNKGGITIIKWATGIGGSILAALEAFFHLLRGK